MRRPPFFLPAWLIVTLLLLVGCQTNAPMHVWQPPLLESTVGKRVVVSAVAGPESLASRVREQLLAMSPSDAGRQFELMDYQSLPAGDLVQLVSLIEDEPNDLALASIARRNGAQYLLRGEVIETRSAKGQGEQEADSLTISWCLLSLEEGGQVDGQPIAVSTASALERYPDLAVLGNQDDVLVTAAVRDSYRLMTPSIRRDEAQVANSYWLPGSSEVRRGNEAARAGRWGEAEEIWKETIRRHPSQVAAIHNLALAAAAGQDFSRAKQLSRRAIRLRPSRLHQQTLAWIETRQRAYHKAFSLPDPPEGWFITADDNAMDETARKTTSSKVSAHLPSSVAAQR
jgi:tetratricopeptide (TPR) repeat protein